MKILYVHITQNLGGVEKRFFSYFQYLINRSDNQYTFIVSKTFLGLIKKDIKSCNVNQVLTYGRIWKRTNRFTRYIDYLYLAITILKLRRQTYDIAHFTTSASRLFSNCFNARQKFISAVTSPKKWLTNEIESSRFKKMIGNQFGIDCLDSNIQSTIQEKYPNFKKNIFVSPCSFISSDIQIPDIEKEHSISFVGRLIPEKGADLLLRVLPDIIKLTSFKIYILGRGILKPKFEDLIKDNGWSNRIVLTYDRFPPRIMMRSCIFLSLQREENYPSQSLLEAMYCKNAIIATNVGLTHKLVTNKNGFLVNSQMELLDKLLFFDNNSIVCKSMGEASFSILTQNHSLDNFHDYLQNCYKEMINSKIQSTMVRVN